MSRKPDIKEEAEMPFQEKFAWVTGVVTAAVAAVYFAIVLPQVRTTPVAEIAYQRPLLVAIGALVALTIVAMIAVGIGTGIWAEVTGTGSADDIGTSDERDDDINRRGELVGYYVSSAGVVGAIALAMLRYDQFWIANALYLSFVVGGLAAAAAKLVAYRRGF